MPDEATMKPLQEGAIVELMQPMLETMLSLLGRQVFSPETLKQIVTKRKRRPNDYIKAYNLCDGEHSINQIAKEIGVSIGTLSPILADWKEHGIIYEVSSKGAKFYKRLYPLRAPKATERAHEDSDQGEAPEGNDDDQV